MIVDLTHTMHPDMPVYPGTEQPVFAQGTTIEADGFAEKKLTLYSHTGTHLDAPAHLIEGGITLDQLPLTTFVGEGCMIDVRGMAEVDANYIKKHGPMLRAADFLILRTGFEEHWGTDEYFGAFPVLSKEAAEYLTTLELRGVLVDAISVDPVDDMIMPVHHALLGADMVIVENLCNLGQLPSQGFTVSALPLKIENGDGSPVRAIAML